MFYFRLALAIGKTVGQLLAETDSPELSEWLAFSRIEPFGVVRSDVQAAVVASTIANCNRKQESPPFKLTTFMPFHRQPEQTPEEQFAAIRAALTGIPEKKGG